MNRTARCSAFSLAITLAVVLAVPALAADHPTPLTPRSEVPADVQWNVGHIYADVAAWEADRAALAESIPHLATYEGKLGESADVLLACLQERDEALRTLYKLYAYANSRLNVQLDNAENQGLQGKLSFLMTDFGKSTAYIEPEILGLDEAALEGFLADNADLGVYGYYIGDLVRQKAHTLTPAEERLLALAGNVRGVSGTVAGKLRDVEMDFPEIVVEDGSREPLTLASFPKYRSSASYNVRKQAADAFFTTFRKFENSLAACLDGAVKSHLLTKDARGYDSCLAASLTPDNISPATYRMLIDTIDENLGRTLHKYITLRRKVMGLDGPVTFPNLYNPMLSGAEREYSYAEGRELILEAIKPMGKKYMAKLTEGTDPANGWIDIYPNENKRTGAYSMGIVAADVHPYVLHNFDDSLDAVFTTAHEFGHALHSHFSAATQPQIYADYTTFLAEIASTCNEELLLNFMLKREKDPGQKLLLLNKRLENIRQTIFRQTLFAEFELRFHEYAEEGNVLTADFLNGLYAELIQKYYGPDFEMGPDDCVEWAFIPHFFYNFYVFTYATGLTSGISMAELILDDGQKAADRYIDNMLCAGSSAPPLEILKNAGVDLETPQPILTMLDLFEKTVDEFDELWTKTYE